ncbi:hypothetical protein D3C81_2316500 [compost metagenome]
MVTVAGSAFVVIATTKVGANFTNISEIEVDALLGQVAASTIPVAKRPRRIAGKGFGGVNRLGAGHCGE